MLKSRLLCLQLSAICKASAQAIACEPNSLNGTSFERAAQAIEGCWSTTGGLSVLLLVASTDLSAGMEPSETIMTAAGLLGASFTSELPSIMAGLLYPADSLLPRMPGLQRQASLPLPPLPALLQPDQGLGLARQLSLPTVLAGHAAAAAGTSATGPASDLPVDATTRKRPGRPKVPRVNPATLVTEEERRLQERKQRNRDAAAASRHVPGMLPPHSRSRR
jgi:hypothetical protein